MTPKQLLGLTADDFERLSDTELEAIFAPKFHVTRPESLRDLSTEGPIKRPTSKKAAFNKKLEHIKELAKQQGFDLEYK